MKIKFIRLNEFISKQDGNGEEWIAVDFWGDFDPRDYPFNATFTDGRRFSSIMGCAQWIEQNAKNVDDYIVVNAKEWQAERSLMGKLAMYIQAKSYVPKCKIYCFFKNGSPIFTNGQINLETLMKGMQK